MGEDGPTPLTNVHVYLSIAEEAASESNRLQQANRRPKPDGQPGWIITLDPDQRSFKQAMVALAFSGMYLEALLGLVGAKLLGRDGYRKFERRTYEEKLKRFGVKDSQLLANCRRFREARNDLMHEKAFDETTWRVAQEEAAHAISVIRAVRSALGA